MNAKESIPATVQIVEIFKAFYAHHNATDLTKLENIYASDVMFCDPLHQIRGLAKLRDYLAGMYDNLSECRFEYLDELVGEDSAYIKWNMHFRHPRFNNKLITVRGVSQIQFDQRICFHEDVYDVGAMVYEHVPVFGSATRWLKERLGQSGRAASYV